MNLTVDQLMTQAIRFLQTGQPRMAALYLTRALDLLEQDRERARVQAQLDLLLPIYGSAIKAIQQIWTAMAEALVPAVQAAAEAFKAFGEIFLETYQSDFALEA